MGQCLKCGKKTEGNSVFCGECLTVMERYPVKPGTVVHLPHRNVPTEQRSKEDYDAPTPAEQITHYRGIIRWLTAVVAGLSILLVITAVLLIHTLDQEQPLPIIGRNYTTNSTGQQP